MDNLSLLDDLVSVSGVVDHVVFSSNDTGFSVLRVKASGQRERVTVVGNAAGVSAGEQIQASGNWFNDPKHGMQLRAETIRILPPDSIDGIKKFLSSGLIKGIGKEYAGRLVRKFGKDVLHVIEHEPDRLSRVEGIGVKRAKLIQKSWKERVAVRDVMVFLQSYGMGTANSFKIAQTYGDLAISKVKENPYRIAKDIRGMGFLTADKMALSMGIEKDALVRLQAGVAYVLQESASDGNCGLPVQMLLDKSKEILEADIEKIKEAIAIEVKDGFLIKDNLQGQECLFLASYYMYERTIAKKLHNINSLKSDRVVIETEKAVSWVEQKLGINLAARQKEAVALGLKEKVLVITGGPGTGKTTLVRSIVEILSAKSLKIKLAAPTGRAAKRLSESSGLAAKTIHRLLEYSAETGGFLYDSDRHLKADIVIIDEVSMIDVALMQALMSALSNNTRIIMVGDVDQLPSVGPGQVLTDIIFSGCFPVVRLNEIFRQGENSHIAANAYRINNGKMPELLEKNQISDFYMIEAKQGVDFHNKIIEVVTNRIPAKFGFNAKKDIQVLCPMQKGGAGVKSINVELQKVLNPNSSVVIEKAGQKFSVGDKVMQIENNYEKEVFNGDIGFIIAIDKDKNEMSVEIDGKYVKYDFSEIDQLVLAYATTIHKSQGSEYPVVVLALTMQHYIMLRRNLVYTGVTRGKKLVVIIGEKKALFHAVNESNVQKRYSKLCEFLQDFGV